MRDHIYARGWQNLRRIQVEACEAIFNTSSHVLLTSGTASGKTEAAFFPAVTMLCEDPPASIGILYVCPTKALINDQFSRLDLLMMNSGIPVRHWHGDVSRSEKKALMDDPAGILQITPESLEGMLLNRSNHILRIFGDLRFVVVDEAHYFIFTERGRQLLCQLERIARIIGREPRRIGLSATLGNPEEAGKWLASGTAVPTVTLNADDGKRRIKLAVEHFTLPEERHSGPRPIRNNAYWDYLYRKTLGRKCIIFTNSEQDAEDVITTIRENARNEGNPDIYHVHHGCISTPFRELAEEELRDSHQPIVTGATMTLELGVDVGNMERIVQIEAPFAVDCLLQRLGRSGRRGDPAEMFFVHRDVPRKSDIIFDPEDMPWQMLQVIAMLQLYLEERWIEPVDIVRYPFSILYHQTMSILAASGELNPKTLPERVLSLSVFDHITTEDFFEMIRHLLEIEHLQWNEDGGVMIGLEGEKMIGSYKFLAVFKDFAVYQVRCGSEDIGIFNYIPPIGDRILLTGRCWEVIDYHVPGRKIFVRPVRGLADTASLPGMADIHTRILQRMRQVLLEDTVYGYLQPGARAKLEESRRMFRSSAAAESNVFQLFDGRICLLPWIGSKTYRALRLYLRHLDGGVAVKKGMSGRKPYYVTIPAVDGGADAILAELQKLCTGGRGILEIADDSEIPPVQKYDEFIPKALLKKYYLLDFCDPDELKRMVPDWTCA